MGCHSYMEFLYMGYLFTFLPFYRFTFLPFYLFTFLPFYLAEHLPNTVRVTCRARCVSLAEHGTTRYHSNVYLYII